MSAEDLLDVGRGHVADAKAGDVGHRPPLQVAPEGAVSVHVHAGRRVDADGVRQLRGEVVIDARGLSAGAGAIGPASVKSRPDVGSMRP